MWFIILHFIVCFIQYESRTLRPRCLPDESVQCLLVQSVWQTLNISQFQSFISFGVLISLMRQCQYDNNFVDMPKTELTFSFRSLPSGPEALDPLLALKRFEFLGLRLQLFERNARNVLWCRDSTLVSGKCTYVL